MKTTRELIASGNKIKDGTAAYAVIRNGRGIETGRIVVIYCAAVDMFMSIPE